MLRHAGLNRSMTMQITSTHLVKCHCFIDGQFGRGSLKRDLNSKLYSQVSSTLLLILFLRDEKTRNLSLSSCFFTYALLPYILKSLSFLLSDNFLVNIATNRTKDESVSKSNLHADNDT